MSEAKLTQESAVEIRKGASGGKTFDKLAADFGVSRRTVIRVVRNQAWKGKV